MAFESFIGMRYLRAKRSKSVLSIITIISISGVALGVTALIVVLSVMGGFKKDLKEKILGTRAHIVIKAHEAEPIKNFQEVATAARSAKDVIGASAFLEGEVMISSPTNLKGVVLRGIDIEHVSKISTLEKDMQKGSLHALTNDKNLMEGVEKKRKQDLDDIMKRLETERKEIELDRAESGIVKYKPVLGPKKVKENSKEQSGAFKMPPLPGEDSEESDVFKMPDLPGTEEETVMPGFDDDPEEIRVPGLIIGTELQTALQVKLGDEVNVVTPNGEMGPLGPMPRSRPFRIVGVFYSGMYEYDASYAYTSIDDALHFLDAEGASGIELRTVSVENATATAMTVRDILAHQFADDKHKILDWKEINSSLFFALKLEKIAMFVVLTFIILVASFSIIAMLIMIVIEKGREIAILKSIGASNSEIRSIFIFQGMVIGIVGSAIGFVLGLLICFYLSQFGFPLNPEVYYINTLPVDVNPWEIGFVLICAVGISFLATIYPAHQASKLNPVDGLRYE